MDGGTGGVGHISFEGNRQVPNVWWNRSKRKTNLNWFDNDWNANYWFAFVREFLYSSVTTTWRKFLFEHF